MKKVQIAMPTRGVDIRASDTSLMRGTVRSAVNVDIATSGEFSRRRGFALATPATNLLAISATDMGVYVHRAGEILMLDERTNAMTHLCDFPGPDQADFQRHNNYLYATNGDSFVKIRGTTALPVATPLPARLPDLAVGAGGLSAGTYGVIMTALDQFGEESAAAYLGAVAVPDAGGVNVVGFQPDGRTYRFYMTHANGDIAYLLLEMPVVTTEVRLTAAPEGAPAPPLGRVPLPAGTFVCGHAGRLYTARFDTVFFSDAFAPHLSQAGHNFIKFEGDITVLEAVPTGLFVGDSRGVWFLEGQDPDKFSMRLASDQVAGMASSAMVPASALPVDARVGEAPLPIWLTETGYVAGLPSGSCKSFISDRISVEGGIAGRSTVLETGGHKQLITLTAAPWGSIGSTINSFNPAS
jgi:hypothetical protein